MLAWPLAFAFTGAPDPTAAAPVAPALSSAELPHWRSVPEPSSPPAPTKPKSLVPVTGTGFLALGGTLLVSGGTMEAVAIGLATTDKTDAEGLLALAGGPLLGCGIVFVSIGSAVRRQYRASPAAIPDAPRTGGGMQLTGLALMIGGSGAALGGAVNLVGSCYGCGPYYTQGAALSLGLGLASVAVGSGLMIGGAARRGKYKTWARGRTAMTMLPTFSLTSGGLQLGIVGRF